MPPEPLPPPSSEPSPPPYPFARLLTATAGLRSAAFRPWLVGYLFVFFAFLLANGHLFSDPLVETADHAVNAIQVYEAKHLRELHGNYSQFGFHHPGPALFYVFAAGELIFYDITGVAASPFAAHSLALILITTLSLFLSIWIVSRFVPNVYFPALGLASTLVVAVMINHHPGTAVNSAFVSLWIPHTLIFFAVLMAVSCSAVAVGDLKVLPALTFAACMLTHLHVAQIQYTAVLTLSALVTFWFLNRRTIAWRDLWRNERSSIRLSLAILALFLLPLLLEPLFYKPSNIELILGYMSQKFGRHHTLGESIRYLVTFLSLSPEAAPRSRNPVVASLAEDAGRLYWGALFLVAATAVSAFVTAAQGLPRFFGYLVVHCVVMVLLFVNWSMTITGPQYFYHGHFIYSLHILAWWGLIGLALYSRPAFATPMRLVTAFAVPAAIIILGAPHMKMPTSDNPIARIVSAKISAGRPVRTYLTLDGNLPNGEPVWAVSAGVANQLHRANFNYCVPPGWVNLFGPAHICVPDASMARLTYAPAGTQVSAPCEAVFQNAEFSMILSPPATESMWPVTVSTSDCIEIKAGFHGNEGAHRWTEKYATVSFRIPATETGAAELVLTGGVSKAPMLVSVNGTKVGEVSLEGAMAENKFPIPAGVLRPGQANEVALDLPNATPLGADPRVLGFMFKKLEITGVPSR